MNRFLDRHAAVAVVLLAGCNAGQEVAPGAVQTLATSGASNPTVAADGSGSFLVAWVQASEDGGNVYMSRLGMDGVAEGEPVRVNDLVGDADPHEQAPAQVAVAPNGDVYVVWQRRVDAPWLEFGGADLRLARSTDGGRSFEPAITVNDNPPGLPARVSFHNVAVADDGEVVVSWIDARVRDNAREVVYRAQQAGTPLDEGATAQPEPGTEMRVAVSHDGGHTFGASVVVDGNTCPCCRTSLALAEGSIYVSWRKIFDGGIRDIAVARSTDGGQSFAEAHPVHADRWEFGGCPHAGPSLAVDSEGRLHAAWYTGREDRQGLWYAVSDDGGMTFTDPLAILTDEWVPPSQARLAVANGTVWVTWDDLRQAEKRVRLARIEGGTVREVPLEAVGQSPALAFDGATGVLAWHDGESVRAVTIGGG